MTVTTTDLGLFALLGTPAAGPWEGVLEQEIATVPASATLSLLYRVVGTVPDSDTLQVRLIGAAGSVTHTLPLTTTGWVHRWWDLTAWDGPTATLRLEWVQMERSRSGGVILDEISLGTGVVGAYPVYVPLVWRGP